jgi:hypothetical protein
LNPGKKVDTGKQPYAITLKIPASPPGFLFVQKAPRAA